MAKWTKEEYNTWARADYAAHPEKYKAKAKAKRRYHRVYNYMKLGLTKEEAEQWDAIRRCELCGKSGLLPKRMALDHCHKTGRIRGKLCTRCNVALGGFNDDPDTLRRAIEYLERNG